MYRLQAEHLYKVFGADPEDGVRRLEAGAGRDELRESGTTAAVIDASFDVREGEIFVVMGLSGSGKSTLLRTLNGLNPPTAGRVLFDGRDLTALSARELRRVRSHGISMVFQHFALFPHRSVLQNAAYGLEVQGVGRREREARAAQALELTGLSGWGDSWPDELSGGMQQRVGLARALATDADVLLMDESFSALDPLIRRDMQDQLLELQRSLKKTIVFITHDLNEAMRLGDRVAVMRDGRIVQVGTPEDVLLRPADDYVSSFVHDVDRSRVLTAGTVMEPPRRPDAGDCRCETVTPHTALADVLPVSARVPHPVAVRDKAGDVVGVIAQERLLAALGDYDGPAAPCTDDTACTHEPARADGAAREDDAGPGVPARRRKEAARA